MKISIIIPVHNAEKFLARCLNSVIRALQETDKSEGSDTENEAWREILLVENGSSDKSLEICRRYQKQYTLLIKIIDCQLQGAGVARNLGIKNAQGDYVWFIDADDEIAENSILKLLKATKIREDATYKKADLVMMGAERIYMDGQRNYLSAVTPNEKKYKSRFVRYGAGPWQFLIRREWWNRHNFQFREGIIHEDMELISALILYTDNFAAIDEPLYFYYQNPESILHKTSWDAHAFDIFPALEGLYRRFQSASAEQKYHAELEWFFIWNLLIDSAKDFARFPEGRGGFARSREMLRQYFPNWRKNRFFLKKPLKLRLRCYLNYIKR